MKVSIPGVLLASLLAVAAHGQSRDVRIDISGGGQRTPLVLEALQPGGDRSARTWSTQADEVLARDLEWSAVFNVSRLSEGAASSSAQAVVGGKLTVNGGSLRLEGEVRDLPARRPILIKEYRGRLADWRALVHRFADDIVLQFTGEPGVSSTRIAFMAKTGAREKELFVMDYDGANLRSLTRDRSIALSPAWSPDGSLLLFTSYRGGRGPRLYVIADEGGKPYLISGRPGLNTSGSYSPTGREIVCTLNQDGNSEIYLLDARGGSPLRRTDNRAIDTSPAWSPTGRELAFTSDRGGAPQVHVMDREGGNLRRLTYEVSYTDSPAWSPKGDQIAFVTRTGGGFDIYVCRADGSAPRRVVGGGSNENPRWSPDGRHLVFASDRGGGGFGLYVTDLDGTPPRKLDTGGRTAMSPAWSPRPSGGGSAMNIRGTSP